VDHQLRRSRLTARVGEMGVDAILVTHGPNVRYLTGFTGSAGAVLLSETGCVLVTDGRYREQAAHEVDEVDVVTSLQGSESRYAEQVAQLGVRRLGFEAAHVSVAGHRRLADELAETSADGTAREPGGVDIVPLDDPVERDRWAKDTQELDALRRAQATTDDAFDEILERIAVGMTERQLALELEVTLRRDGAEGLAFDPIVAFGDHASEPHHAPGHRMLEEGDVVKLDFGARWEGYHADMTRTVAFGEPATELRKIHDVVREAQQAGIDAVREGETGGSVDAAARKVIEDAGYGDRFAHGLGHGVGLEIHEGPWLRRDGSDVLPAGAVVTVEPGIYVPGLGGVRIEDMVEVTPDGSRVLGTSTRELIEL
jgi:Xaa-Pro aminopeptidase